MIHALTPYSTAWELKNALKCLHSQDATKFYKEQSKSLWYDVDSVDDFAVYVRDAVEAIGREEQLAVTCLHHTTTPKLIKACTKELVVNASKTINFYNKLVFCSLRESVMVRHYLSSYSIISKCMCQPLNCVSQLVSIYLSCLENGCADNISHFCRSLVWFFLRSKNAC